MREEARYVLHLWRDGRRANAWRASLTNVRTRRVHRFADTAALHAFLDERTARSASPLTEHDRSDERDDD